MKKQEVLEILDKVKQGSVDFSSWFGQNNEKLNNEALLNAKKVKESLSNAIASLAFLAIFGNNEE